MPDTLNIFGTEYTNVAGIIAKDDNEMDQTYIKPQGTKSITQNGTGIDVSAYASVDVAVPSSVPSLQTKTKTYTPTESSQTETVTADSGYDGLDEVNVTVNAVSSTYVGSGVTRKSATTYNVSTSNQTIAADQYLSGVQTIRGVVVSSNLTAENVKSGVTITVGDSADADRILSVTGTYAGGGGTSKNVQIYFGYASRTANSYGATSVTLTVAKTGTYKVSYMAWRGSSSGTMGTNLYRNETPGTNQQTWIGTYGQVITLNDQSYNKDDVLTLYATSGSSTRTVYCGHLIIEEQ